MRFYTKTQACRALGLNPRTLTKWLEETRIEPQTPANDKRTRRLSQEDMDALAHYFERPLRAPESEGELRARIAVLETENGQLKRENETLRTALGGRAKERTRPPRPVAASVHANDELPDGWLSLNAICLEYHVNAGTAKNAIGSGVITCERGSWKVGRTYCEYAFTPDQQRDFLVHFGLAKHEPQNA